MNIYEIDQAILALVDQETGEITDWEAFDQLQMDKQQKIENVACWYKNLLAEAAAIRQEELNLAARRQTLEKQAENKKKYLENVLAGQKFQTARCSITWRKTQRVEVSEPALAIAWAMTHGHNECVKQSIPTLAKDELARVLKNGEEVPGAELVYGSSMGVK